MRTLLLALLAVPLLAGAFPRLAGAPSPEGATLPRAAAPELAAAPLPPASIARAVRRAGADAAVERLRADVDAVLAAPGWRRAVWSVLVVSLDSGDTLYARAPERAMAPASNLKLFTTAAALHHLGEDYRFVTLALAGAAVRDGVLEGNLVLYGTGDPGISKRFHASDPAVLDSLALRLRASGLRVIEGDVLGDGTFFDGPVRRAEWDHDDLNAAYAAASDALSYAENVVTLRVEATVPGVPPHVHGIPDLSGVDVRNDALTVRGRPETRLVIERDEPLDPIRVKGQMAPGSRDVWRQMTVQVPALYAAHAFREALERAGIVVSGQPGVVEDRSRSLLGRGGLFGAGSGPRVLARHTSEPLGAYLAVINQESHNLFADLVLKTLGRMVVGEGSYDAGAGVVQRFLTDEVGIAPGTVTMLDGSGLASGNRATPEAFVALLGYMSGRDDWPIYWSTLPEAGTRKLRRMQRTAAALNLRAKTGTIDGVSALSGIVRTARGERVAFSIVGNDLPSAWAAKRLEDRIGARLAELDRGPSTDLGADPATARARDARQP